MQLEMTITLSFEDNSKIPLEKIRDQYKLDLLGSCEPLLEWARDITGDHYVELDSIEVK